MSNKAWAGSISFARSRAEVFGCSIGAQAMNRHRFFHNDVSDSSRKRSNLKFIQCVEYVLVSDPIFGAPNEDHGARLRSGAKGDLDGFIC
jgi:hypothetical protein